MTNSITQCPLCAGDMCGCYECMNVKRFRSCKGCSELFKAQFGRRITNKEIRRAVKRLIKMGKWDGQNHTVPAGKVAA